MKCNYCNGEGELFINDHSRNRLCPVCEGTGEVEMTNEYFLQTATTEQLAEWLVEHIDCVICCCKKDLCCKDYDSCKLTFIEWLKQPHTRE